ncbi:autotransporter assembly complex protein TamA [Pseudoalteromonas umbrosa]|uniref:autotransporter assembly complex protein TamA n=1 Tax=Pseudoalteromonas umbrosa TaxID=3048489 RepID=UPI0024C3E3A8|nr:autotransporter assembly complex family protein [Pseudoalteromonas sp. B95]MDK1287536.1 autotransporter assembly complex family protein [Pseudoalteromonas sp. B95]
MPRLIVFFITLFVFILPSVATAQMLIKTIEVHSKSDLVDENVALYLEKYHDTKFSHRQEKAIRADIHSALQAVGYYEFNSDISFSEQVQTLSVDIVLSTAFHWQDINVQILGAGSKDLVLSKLLNALPIKRGENIRHDAYSATKSKIESALLERGYFDFTWQQSALEINRAQKHGAVKLIIDSGPRYKFGELQLSGFSKAAYFISELAPFEQGDHYDAKQLSELSISLNETPYFANVTVYPLLKERYAGQVPIRVDVTDKPANSFEVGGGYSTELGAKFRFKWKRPWVNQMGHSFETDLNVSERKQDVTSAYTIPAGDPNDDLWRVLGGYQLQDDLTEGVKVTAWNVQLQRQWVLDSGWVRTAFLKREHEKSEQTGLTLDTEMLLPGVSYARKMSKGGMTPYWGNEQLITIEAAHEDVISSTSLTKIHWKQAWLRTYKARHLFLLKGELGAVVAKDFDKTPLNLRFFAGGDQSIRGFAFQSISPKGEQGELLGAKYLVTASTEYNYEFLPNWRAAIFIDGGTATNDFEEKWSVGAGFGFRYITPFGPIRVDHAWGLSKPSRSTRLSVVIGPEI